MMWLLLVLTLAAGPQAPGAVVTGVVSAADTGRPIGGAEVVLEPRRAGARRMAKTDSSGRYEIAGVVPGAYVVHVRAARFIAHSMSQRTGEAPGPLNIAEGERLELDVPLVRYGAIGGRVLDHFGDPLPGATVVALRRRFVDGLARLEPAGGTLPSRLTDDLGEFRVHTLPAGEYVIAALTGPFTAVHPYNTPNDTGGFRPTFYPSALSARDAVSVRLGAGEEREGLTIAMQPGRGVRVSGTAVDSTGQPFARGLMSIVSADAAASGAVFAGRDQAATDGTFRFSNVPPGSYVVQARSLGTTGSFSGEFGWLPVTVGGADVSELLVQTSPGSTVRARITIESDRPGERTPMGATPILVPADLASQPVLPTGSSSIEHTVGERTEMTARQMWGNQLFRLPTGRPWLLKSVVVGGRDVTDTPLELRGQAVTADIVVSETAATIKGRVLDQSGKAAAGCTVIVFASDRALWTPRSRFVHAVTANADGEFSVYGVSPERYLAAALDDVAPGRWADPEFLASLSAASLSFPVIEREVRTIDLGLTPSPGR